MLGFLIGVLAFASCYLADFVVVFIISLLCSVPILGRLLAFIATRPRGGTPSLLVVGVGLCCGFAAAALLIDKLCRNYPKRGKIACITFSILMALSCIVGIVSAISGDGSLLPNIIGLIIAGTMISHMRQKYE